MGETVSALVFIASGIMFIFFCKEGRDEKYKIRVDGKPVDIRLGELTVNLSQLIMICLGIFLIFSGGLILLR